MSEENKAVELNENDLEQISGGDVPTVIEPSESSEPSPVYGHANCRATGLFKNHDCTMANKTIYGCEGCPGYPLTED